MANTPQENTLQAGRPQEENTLQARQPAVNIKVGMVSLGCAKNTVDSEVMLGLFAAHGWEITNDPAAADVIVVNTCTFIADATSESVDTVLEMSHYKLSGRCRALILAGCMATRYREQLLSLLPEVDAVVGTGEVTGIVEAVEKALAGEKHYIAASATPTYIYDDSTRRVLSTAGPSAYVKIADGCDHRCAYCIIPTVRGSFRSRRMESIVDETRQLAADGRREICLIAQDSTRYGCDLYGEPRLAELLQVLADIEDIKWLRLLYVHPDGLSDDILKVIASHPTICKYIDLPLQHASAQVLHRMGRTGGAAELLALVERLRAIIPQVAVRTTFIVGYPGETESDFATLCDFIEKAAFDHVGVFAYSREEGTRAAALPNQVPKREKERRRRVAMEMQRRISLRKNEGLVGTCQELLVEQAVSPHVWKGRLARQAPDVDGITYIHGANLSPGVFVTGRIVKAAAYDLTAEAESCTP